MLDAVLLSDRLKTVDELEQVVHELLVCGIQYFANVEIRDTLVVRLFDRA